MRVSILNEKLAPGGKGAKVIKKTKKREAQVMRPGDPVATRWQPELEANPESVVNILEQDEVEPPQDPIDDEKSLCTRIA